VPITVGTDYHPTEQEQLTEHCT